VPVAAQLPAAEGEASALSIDPAMFTPAPGVLVPPPAKRADVEFPLAEIAPDAKFMLDGVPVTAQDLVQELLKGNK
jgi:hypothetical protein